MDTHDLYRRQTAILTCIILALISVLWWTTSWKAFFAGFFLGGVAGLYNALYLIRRLRLIDLQTVEQDMSASSGKQRVNLGLANRFLMAAFPMLLAVRFPEWIDYRSVLLGLPVPYIILITVGLRHTQRQFSRGKR
jgi:hypothetical protein